MSEFWESQEPPSSTEVMEARIEDLESDLREAEDKLDLLQAEFDNNYNALLEVVKQRDKAIAALVAIKTKILEVVNA